MMTDEEVDDFLVHYGVKGMRWGVRKSRKKAGVGRASGAKLDRNARRKAYYEKKISKSGRGYTAPVMGVISLLPERKRKAILQKRVDRITAADKRIKSGNRSAKDVIQTYGGVALYGPAGVLVSVKPKRN